MSGPLLARLRDLDSRMLPGAARRVGAWVAQLADLRDRTAEQVAEVRSANGTARLERLDRRYATSGPLHLLREVPQLGFALIALLFLTGAGAAVVQHEDGQPQQQQGLDSSDDGTVRQAPEETDNILGPLPGDIATAYVKEAAAGVVAATRSAPDAPRVVLISFAAYRTPAQTQALLAGAKVVRVFLRAGVGGKDAAQLPVEIKDGDLAGGLRAGFAKAAQSRAVAQKSYQGYVDTLTVTTNEEQQFKDQYAAFAKSTGREAQAYRNSCACVYAAVVLGTAKGLAALRSRPGVRAVEVSGPGAKLIQLQIHPLLPEVRGAVPGRPTGVG